MTRLAVIGGVLLGAVAGLLAFAPAAWLADGVASATGQRLLLADARGTVWRGSAVAVLTGGEGSRDAAALPGRLEWTVGLSGRQIVLTARHECCLNGVNGELRLLIAPGIGGMKFTLPPAAGVRAQWPAGWLAGLGTPWNTLQLGGWLRLTSPGLALESVEGRWRFDGRAELALDAISSRLSTLPKLGAYRVNVAGTAATGDAGITLSTTEGPLQLSGSGQWAAGRLRFRGEARAAEGFEAVLNNLLNLIGRRQGALSVISIG